MYPNDTICVGEIISHWYGLGRSWINTRLHIYVSLDRNPENGFEIQKLAYGQLRIMLSLRNINTKGKMKYGNGLLQTTSVLNNLVKPWASKDGRTMCD